MLTTGSKSNNSYSLWDRRRFFVQAYSLKLTGTCKEVTERNKFPRWLIALKYWLPREGCNIHFIFSGSTRLPTIGQNRHVRCSVCRGVELATSRYDQLSFGDVERSNSHAVNTVPAPLSGCEIHLMNIKPFININVYRAFSLGPSTIDELLRVFPYRDRFLLPTILCMYASRVNAVVSDWVMSTNSSAHLSSTAVVVYGHCCVTLPLPPPPSPPAIGSCGRWNQSLICWEHRA